MSKQVGSRLWPALIFGLNICAAAEGVVGVTEITPNVLLFSTDAGNVVASLGPDGALLVGTPSVASTSQIAAILTEHTRSAVRYVVIFPQDLAHSNGDAGWVRRGAFVAMQENALGRLGGHSMGPPQALPGHLIELGVDRPRAAFSEVLTFDLNGEAIHIVHQPPAYSDADAIAHFHVASLVYLGEIFPGDGYPTIDPAQGGKLEGLMKTLGAWTGDSIRVVPAYGNVTNGAAVKAFRDMIVTVRGRVQDMIRQGRSEDQIVASHPAAEFDQRWGHGRVAPDVFVREIDRASRTQ